MIYMSISSVIAKRAPFGARFVLHRRDQLTFSSKSLLITSRPW